ncbi:aminotransferase class III-fold pyridoxal phosphate-dependent enzyme, partial [Klebsiella pneumoniae]|nr:aminotransferase class III-fold pyridoxal phosphate-dependent enzyme [Klebsiella pneumoniae]
GNTYLDFFAGILTNAIGYDIPEISDAIRKQVDTGILHTSTLYLIRNQVELAERIASLSGMKNPKVFFTNSGTEANETALLLATQHRRSNQILALRNSYHGRSFAAMGVTGNRGWSASSLSPVKVSYVHGGYRYR